MYNRLPVVVLRGRYTVDGRLAAVEMQAQPAGEYPFRIDNGELLIKSRNGAEKRVQAARDVAAQGVLSGAVT